MRTEHELFLAALELLDSLCAIGCMSKDEVTAFESIEHDYYTFYANMYNDTDE